VPPDAPQQTFFNVANDFFRDGIISWGRVATLFYFGYKMALKVSMFIIFTCPTEHSDFFVTVYNI
jgi:hypothetical protein